MKRIIGLIDLDYFFAQCEIIKNPALKNKPVVVVMQTVRENTGAVATCNYEARALKIRSGMSMSLAKKLANNDTFFIKADKEKYKEISDNVFEILDKYSESIEQVSIDEAYFDLSKNGSFEKAKEECKKIKDRIFSETGLTCSIGVGPNKLIAKMCSEEKKPNGLFLVNEIEIEKYLNEKPIEKLHGLGPKSKKALNEINVNKVSELKEVSKQKLIELFGKSKGEQFYDFARGIDQREININREKKQISRLMTLKEDTLDINEIKKTTDFLCERVYEEAKKEGKKFKTISVILINEKFDTITKSITPEVEINSKEELIENISLLLENALNESIPKIRRAGVRVSNFSENMGYQKRLFDFGG